MKTHPGEYGFSKEQITALTEEELKLGVTDKFMQARGEWLLSLSLKRLNKSDGTGLIKHLAVSEKGVSASAENIGAA